MNSQIVSDKFLILFTPENWNSLERFRRFLGPPFEVDRNLQKGTQTAADHMNKFVILVGLANRLAEDLHLDNEEIDQQGYTPALRSKELAARLAGARGGAVTVRKPRSKLPCLG